jgi:hypothetical protein
LTVHNLRTDRLTAPQMPVIGQIANFAIAKKGFPIAALIL